MVGWSWWWTEGQRQSSPSIRADLIIIDQGSTLETESEEKGGCHGLGSKQVYCARISFDSGELGVRQYWRQSGYNIMRNVKAQTRRRLSTSVDKTSSDVDKEMLSPIQQPRNRLERSIIVYIKAPARQGQRPRPDDRPQQMRVKINRCKLLRKSVWHDTQAIRATRNVGQQMVACLPPSKEQHAVRPQFRTDVN